MPQLIRGLSGTPPSPSSKFRVDLLASFYPQFRYHYLNDSSTFPQAIERHLISCELHKETSVLYLDGISPVEKQHTNSLRQDKRNTALAGVEDCIRDMEKSLEGGHTPHKPAFKILEKKLRGTFYLGQDSWMVLATYLRGQGWDLPEVASESDVANARDFKSGDVATNQQIVGKGQDQEHEPDSRSMYNEQEPFLQILLNAIMNTTQPGTKANMRKITANMELAREFFNRINLFGVSGPPTKPPYPASTIAQPVANQVYVEFKKHYKNGSMELCRKVMTTRTNVADETLLGIEFLNPAS
ncbi:hypothetical protein KI688_000142 [Linnemannia hyalina]|uniref:Uncharacterized protein n=1 Tax=Linnemannia hyalina TaxID=64524 RepID=A0A9P8BZU8_9FUNG|nr:hypothetical protein KI688_000142 [Linnemannia hyalina]